MTLTEMLRLQGMKEDVNMEVVSQSQMGKMIGNGFTQPVIRRILLRMLISAGLVRAQ